MRRRIDTSKLFQRTLIATAVAAALAGPTITWAQTSDGNLRGKAAPGSEVTAKNVATGAIRRTKSGADGTYALVGLPPGTYRVDAGPGTEVTITVSVASTAVVDLAAGASPTPESSLSEITVQSRRPVDVRTSEVGDIVSLHDIETTPQITRNFLEFAELVPGVSFTVDSQGNTSLRGGAQLDSSVNVYIDGISQKDYVAPGGGTVGQSGAQQNGDPGNPFPQLAIDQYKVTTSNYKAEFGDAASAIIVAQTKSGTNEFKGEGFVTFTNQNLRAETPSEIAEATVNDPKASEPSYEFGFAQGGPIIPDYVHFFATWEHKDLALQNTVYPNSVSTAFAQSLLPAGVGSQFGPTTNPFKEDLGFAKIDYEPTDADRFELTGFLRRETQISGGGAQTAQSAATDYKNDVDRGNLRWQHSADAWVNEAILSYQNANSTTSSTNENPQFNYIYFPAAPQASPSDSLITVNGPGDGVGFRYSQTGPELQDNFTLPNLQWFGDHTVKFGGSYQDINLTAQNGSANLNTASYYYAVTPAGTAQIPFEVQFPDVVNGVSSPTVETEDHQIGLYLQDDWNVDQHLSFNLGLRWDYEDVPSFLHFQTPAAVVDAINGPFGAGTNLTYKQVLALGGPNYPGININNYISTGSNRKPETDEIAPRLGFSYDIFGDQNYVIFGGAARSYDRNLFSTLGLETTKIALNTNPQVYFPSVPQQDPFGACSTSADINTANHCYAWNASYLTAAGLATLVTNPSSHEVDLLNNNIKAPYSNQFSIGFRAKVSDWNTAVTLSEIKSYDTIIGHLGNRYANGRAYDSTGAPWGAQGVPGVGSLILWDNAGRDENLQVGLSATKPYTKESGWSATVAYTFTDAYQTNTSGNSADYNVNYNQYEFDYPFPYLYPFQPSNAVPKHRVVATYSHDLPWDIVFAAKLTVSTPIPVGGAAGCPGPCNAYGGSTIDVSGQLRDTIGYRDVDVQITKNIVFNNWSSLYVRFDVLNLFNNYNFDSSAAIWNQSTTPPVYNTSGPIVGVPLTLKLSAGMKW